jgi:histidinol-phosphate aminotransferase
MYSVCAQLQGANIIEIPLDKTNGYQLNMPAMLSNISPNNKIIFLCSPNNPTGNSLNKNDILTLCHYYSKRSLIVVDEAYIEYSDIESLASSIEQYDNLIILRTFSKAYGLAGIRCGVVLAQADIIQWIMKIIAPYPVPISTSTIVVDTLLNQRQQIQNQIQQVKLERKKLFTVLNKMPFVNKILESDANFLLIETNDANKIIGFCVDHDVVIRNMHKKNGLENCIRISIGTPEENAQLITILDRYNNG